MVFFLIQLMRVMVTEIFNWWTQIIVVKTLVLLAHLKISEIGAISKLSTLLKDPQVLLAKVLFVSNMTQCNHFHKITYDVSYPVASFHVGLQQE